MTLFWPGAPDMEQIPFGRLFRPLDRPVPEDAGIVTAYTDGEVTLRSNRSKIGYHEAADPSGYQGVESGDFVVHGLDILRGSVGISDSSGAMSAVCTVCEPIAPVDLRFVAHAIRVQAQSGYTKAMARGIREGGADFRRWGTLAELPIPMPSLEYQRLVCDFLDVEVAKVDALVAEQVGLVEVLRERRSAVIARAVTQGIDGANLMLSGVPWLGEIATGSAVMRVRFLADIRTGYGDTVDAVAEGSYPFYVRSQTPLQSNDFDYEGPAVLTAGDGAGVAKVFHLVDGRFKAHQRVYVLNNFRHVVPAFFYYFFSTFFEKMALDGSAKSTVDSVRRSMIADMPFVVPSAETQRRVVEYLDEQCSKIDALIAEAEGLVAVAKERQSALITAAVTGQIDVRGEVA